jgi:hypothetical protein
VGSRAFARREVEKCYLAVLEGIVDPTEWPMEPAASEYRKSARMQQDTDDYLLRFQVRCSVYAEVSCSYRHLKEKCRQFKKDVPEDAFGQAIWLNLGKSKFTNAGVYRPVSSLSASTPSDKPTLMIEAPLSSVEGEFRQEVGTFSAKAKTAKTRLEVVEYGTYKVGKHR